MADAPDTSWKGMIAMCEGRGLLAKQLYCVYTKPTNGLGPIMEHIEEHLAYQHKIETDGIMFAAGPHPDDSGEQWGGEGMVVIRASSMEEAEKIAAADPMHSSGARSYTIRPWLVNEGKVTVELTFSNKGSEVI